jgi:hypothetical protein
VAQQTPAVAPQCPSASHSRSNASKCNGAAAAAAAATTTDRHTSPRVQKLREQQLAQQQQARLGQGTNLLPSIAEDNNDDGANKSQLSPVLLG